MKKKMQLVIPLCGIGKRFREAGYKEHKSVLKVNNYSMIERIVKKFPEETTTYLITSIKIKEEIEDQFKINLKLKRIKKNLKFIIIDSHILGPAYSIFKAIDIIPKGIPTFISYCDITWSWENLFFENFDKSCKAIVFCHYGFHPHLVNNNYSAFCLPQKDSEKRLYKIKEKSSFTNEWMNEPLSIGLFFVNDMRLLRSPLEELISNNLKVANEYFPSLLFNYLIKSNIIVNLVSVKSFVHYGTPAHYEDFISWVNYFTKEKKEIKYNNLYKSIIFTSGKGSRMKKFSLGNKSLIKLGNKTLIENILEIMPIDLKNISIIYNNLNIPLPFLRENTHYLKISETDAQLDSLIEASDYIKNQKNFFICSCDCFGLFKEEKFLKKIIDEHHDIVCFGFAPSLLQKNSKSNYSTLNDNNGNVKNIFVKEIKDFKDYGLAGFFWIRNGSKFVEYLKIFHQKFPKINREIIIDDVINFCLSKGLSVGLVKLEKYFHLGTPDELNEYKYWQENLSKLLYLK